MEIFDIFLQQNGSFFHISFITLLDHLGGIGNDEGSSFNLSAENSVDVWVVGSSSRLSRRTENGGRRQFANFQSEGSQYFLPNLPTISCMKDHMVVQRLEIYQ